jgi:hypothetical protein
MRFGFAKKQHVLFDEVKSMLTLKTKTDTLESIKAQTLTGHKVQGKYAGFKWQLVLVYRNPDSMKIEEICTGAARFNTTTNNDVVAFWQTEDLLLDYLKKCTQNRTYIAENLARLARELPDVLRSAVTQRSIDSIQETYAQKTRDIYHYQPNAPILLAESSAAAYNFSLPEIQRVIDCTVQTFLDGYGGFPKKPQLIELNNFKGFAVALKIFRD